MKGWRTLGFNIVVAVGGVLVAFDWVTVVPNQYLGWVGFGVAVLNMGLRAITNTPVGQKY